MGKVKVAFQMVVFNGDYVLEAALEAISGYGPVIVTEGPVQYWQGRGYEHSTDNTLKILRNFRVHKVYGKWEEKDKMMAVAEHMIPKDTTHIWMVDCDEIWKASSIERTIALLDEYDSVSFKPYTFYGGFERYLTGFEQRAEWIRIQRWYPGAHWETHRPPTVLHQDGKPMRQHRHLESPESFYHYSYVFPKQIKDKIDYYTSWGKGVIPYYYEQVYLPWMRAASSMERAQLERKFQGVHEWLPERRGDCFTQLFTGRHPDAIDRRKEQYRMRIRAELADMPELAREAA